MTALRAPFPYYGGKSRAASLVWSALGDVRCYVEPFCGSAAALLARPPHTGVETINDANGFITNFWRAVRGAPDEVARLVDWPVNELDLHARHRWLSEQAERLCRDLEADSDYFDAKVAGWWCWGASQWLGGGWCSGPLYRRKPRSFGHFQGNGVHADGFDATRDIGALCARLRRTRVLCGDWSRPVTLGSLLGDYSTETVAGVFLDPPYAHSAGRDEGCYGDHDAPDVATDVRRWCAENGSNPRLRIVLAGYDVEHADLEARGWRVRSWSAAGFRLSERSKANQHRERLWLSPHCLNATRQRGLFDAEVA